MSAVIAAPTESKTDEEHRTEFYRLLAEMDWLGEEIDKIQRRTGKIHKESQATWNRASALLDHVARTR